MAIAIDIVGSDANIIGFGLACDDGMKFPGGVFKPNDAVAIDDDDVLFTIFVDVFEDDCVSNGKGAVDFLHFEVIRVDGEGQV